MTRRSGDHARLRQHPRAGRRGRPARRRRRHGGAMAARLGPFDPDDVRGRGPRSASASSARRCRSSARWTSPSGDADPRAAAGDGGAAAGRALGRRRGSAAERPRRGRVGRRGLLGGVRRRAAAGARGRRADRPARSRYRLAILSNWPLAATIDRYAEAAGWAPHLAAIVVSQRVGAIKPHPAIFARRAPRSATRRRRRSSTSATTGPPTSSGARVRAGAPRRPEPARQLAAPGSERDADRVRTSSSRRSRTSSPAWRLAARDGP